MGNQRLRIVGTDQALEQLQVVGEPDACVIAARGTKTHYRGVIASHGGFCVVVNQLCDGLGSVIGSKPDLDAFVGKDLRKIRIGAP
jgi:hypothetical protein